MKITTSILAILVLFLSTQCVVKNNLDHGKPIAKETCCLKKKSCQKEEEKKDDGCKEACNPFMACCGCAYIVPEKPSVSFNTISILSVRTGFIPDLFISDYNADCWHPPEIV